MTHRKTGSRRRAGSSTIHKRAYAIHKLARKALTAVAGLSLAVSFVLASLLGLLYDDRFYEKQLKENSVHIDGREMEHVRALLMFFKGEAEAEKGFYSEKELIHLDDVKRLLDNAYYAFLASLGLLIGALATLWIADRNLSFLSRVVLVAGISLLILLLGGGMLLWNFDEAFIGFHHIFFSNDYWQLDPSTDHLIQLFPEPFFKSFAWSLALKAGIAGVLLVAGSFWKP
jgi:integral membrane protein (TIGR01906 family)